jgi:transposase
VLAVTPHLSAEVAKKRLKWAQDHKDWTDKDWEQVEYSDEFSCSPGKGGAPITVFCRPEERLEPRFCESNLKSKISLMIWGSICGAEKYKLIVMERDLLSKSHGYSSNSYEIVLEKRFGDAEFDGIFMQDNAPIHTAIKIKEWFKKRGIILLPHPPYSPDLNPIEHVWAWIKRWIKVNKPDILGLKKNETGYLALEQAIQEAWEAIPCEVIARLTGSMRERVTAIITAKGWHTKY